MLFIGKAIVSRANIRIQRFHVNLWEHRPIFFLSIAFLGNVPLLLFHGNSFRLVHVTESPCWDEQFPGLGKHQGNVVQVLPKPATISRNSYFEQQAIWTVIASYARVFTSTSVRNRSGLQQKTFFGVTGEFNFTSSTFLYCMRSKIIYDL